MTQPLSRLTPDQLTQVRQNTDWRGLFAALQIKKDSKRSKDHDWWGKSPFRPSEVTPSFHMNVKGWYCHSSGQGGGPIELVQRLHSGMNCFEAGKWLLERGLSRISSGVEETRGAVDRVNCELTVEAESKAVNPPIRQDLRSQFLPGHPGFTDRGIPDRVLVDLGAGYLERSPRKNGRPDPMNQRLVFQIRGVGPDDAGDFLPVILGHIGRATTDEQIETHGKWWTYPGFRKSHELYSLDLALRKDTARAQAQATDHILLVEGCFDVAKLWAAGIENVVASFGAHLSAEQVERMQFLCAELDVEQVRILYDRDEAGENGTAEAFEFLSSAGLVASSFNWDQTWDTVDRKRVPIPDSIRDPADFSVGQLMWLRKEGIL